MREKVLQFIELIGLDKIPDAMIENFVEQFREQFLKPPSFDGDLSAEPLKAIELVDSSLKGARSEILDRFVSIYEKVFSEEEIDKLIEFHRSPVGRLIAERGPWVQTEVVSAGDSWVNGVMASINADLAKILNVELPADLSCYTITIAVTIAATITATPTVEKLFLAAVNTRVYVGTYSEVSNGSSTRKARSVPQEGWTQEAQAEESEAPGRRARYAPQRQGSLHRQARSRTQAPPRSSSPSPLKGEKMAHRRHKKKGHKKGRISKHRRSLAAKKGWRKRRARHGGKKHRKARKHGKRRTKHHGGRKRARSRKGHRRHRKSRAARVAEHMQASMAYGHPGIL